MAVVAGDWVIRHIGDWARRHTQLNSTLAKLTKNHEKWTVGRGVVSGYVAPVAQNPAYSPPQPGGAEPPRRSVVGALARPARARAMRRPDWRVTVTLDGSRPKLQVLPLPMGKIPAQHVQLHRENTEKEGGTRRGGSFAEAGRHREVKRPRSVQNLPGPKTPATAAARPAVA